MLGPATPKVFPGKVWCGLVICVMSHNLLLKKNRDNSMSHLIVVMSINYLSCNCIRLLVNVGGKLATGWTHNSD